MEAPISGSLGAMSSLLGKLDYLLKSQHLLRTSLRKHIELLKEDLERINTFLLELSNEHDPNETEMYWMKEVREVSYDIEDYIDRLMHSEAKIGSISVVSRFKVSKLPRTMNRHPKIANQIQELRARLQGADERHKRYVALGYTPTRYSCNLNGRSISTLYGEASRLIVGIADVMEKFLKLLNDGEKQLKVISVFGIGGIGKTTLVKQIFEDHGGQFGFRAFARVSHKPDTRTVLRSILSQTRCRYPFDACNVQQLIACLNEHLRDKRYLIVVDDLWDTTVWDILLHSFPDGTNSSRIIITTAVENLAMTCCADQSDYVLTMEPINMDDSLKLFLTRVFGSEDKCPQHLNDTSFEILKECGGVPLAIITIAGILATQPNNPELWKYVQQSLGSISRTCPTTEVMINVINLGYNGLPDCLKTCLEYVCMYPVNSTIWKDDLVRRWVAEGFINPKERKDIEAVAESYFEELIYRGMIQPIDLNYNNEVLSCTVHNLVLDLLSKKSEEDNFITTIDYSQNIRQLSSKVRRLFLFFSSAKYAAKLSGVTLWQARSLAFYGLIKCMPSIQEFEFLRVLFLHFSDDYGVHTTFNLTGIRRLFQLRYLKVICNFSLQLPSHIEGLQLLETLELDAKMTPVPADVVYLQHLLHLRLPAETDLPDEMGRMRSLRTLKCFDLCSNSEDKVRSLVEVTNLVKLQLICTRVRSVCLDRNLKVLCSILESFCNLKSLALVPRCSCKFSSTSVINSKSTRSPPACLERLEMHPAICIFSVFPEWMRTLRRLCILEIGVAKFVQNDMDSLGGLPGLKVLSLYVQGPTVEPIVIDSGGFQVLKNLKFRCTILNFVFFHEAMPNLRRLKLCFKRNRVLAGIVHLQNLHEIALRIGLTTGEYNTQAAEPASKVAERWFSVIIGELRKIPNFNIQYVNWDDVDDYLQAKNIIDLASHFSHGLLDKTLHEGTNKHSDSRVSKFADVEISSSEPLCSACEPAARNYVYPTKSERDDTATNIVVDMVCATEGAIDEVSPISHMSNSASVEIDQTVKDAELEHKDSSQQQGELRHDTYNAAREANLARGKYVWTASTLINAVPVTEFSYQEIEEATNRFAHSQRIQRGGIGTIYKGHLRYIDVSITIFLRPDISCLSYINQEEGDFNDEVQVLSSIRHPNLVTIIGVCPEAKAVIYEFLPNGSLIDHLKPRNKTEPLSWRMRIRIAVDICRAVLFLHSYKPITIPHGNVNPSNVYLDDNYVAKLDYCFKDCTVQDDVFSFGLLLMSLLSDTPITIPLPTIRSLLASAGDWPPEDAEKLAKLALRCCMPDPNRRPDLGKEAWPILRTMLKAVAPLSKSLPFTDNESEPSAHSNYYHYFNN